MIILDGCGIKSPVEDFRSLSGIVTAIPGVSNRFDLGRYVKLPYIPLFNIMPEINGEVYPMFCDFGDRNGSVKDLPITIIITYTCIIFKACFIL